jgi:FkbM family methyltransferase
MNKINLRGFTLYYNHPHDVAALIEILVLDVYDLGGIKPGDVVLDLGAGIGEFSLAASRRVGSDGLVIAVEPSPIDYSTLLDNIEINEVENVIAMNKALSDIRGFVELEFKGSRFKANSLSIDDLRILLNSKCKNSIDVMKLDIEGAESMALELLSDFLDDVRSIAIEIHGTKFQVDRTLCNRGFSFNRLTPFNYLRSSSKFAILHPISALMLLRLLAMNGERPKLRRMLSGIEITNSEQLMVGVYHR